MANLSKLSDDELDALHMENQRARAEHEAKFKAEGKAIQAERDRRSIAAAVAAVPDEIKAAILAEKGK